MAGMSESDMGALLLDEEGGVMQPQPSGEEESSEEALEADAGNAALAAAKAGDGAAYATALRSLFDLWSSAPPPLPPAEG